MAVIPHPPYTPDLVPCGFLIFPRVKSQMKRKRFADVIEVKNITLDVLKHQHFTVPEML